MRLNQPTSKPVVIHKKGRTDRYSRWITCSAFIGIPGEVFNATVGGCVTPDVGSNLIIRGHFDLIGGFCSQWLQFEFNLGIWRTRFI